MSVRDASRLKEENERAPDRQWLEEFEKVWAAAGTEMEEL